MTDNRRVVANIALSLDGRINGAGGDYDMSWIVPHAITDTARDHLAGLTGPATTALLGRKNFEGFGGYWPWVADDANADPRDRAFAAWLNEVEKVVFSRTRTEASWNNSRITAVDPATEVGTLRAQGGGDIVVLSSTSVIRALLAADAVDRLGVTLCPTIVGGGARFFDDDVPTTGWTLAETTTSETGAICVFYDRNRS